MQIKNNTEFKAHDNYYNTSQRQKTKNLLLHNIYIFFDFYKYIIMFKALLL